MIEKRLRMTLDFEVSVGEITDEDLRKYYRWFTDYDEMASDSETWGNIRRQQRLQLALLADEEALHRFLTYVVINEVDSRIGSRLGAVFGMGREETEEEILEPVFSRLDEEDERYFREVSEADMLWESVEVLSRSFVARWTGASLAEIKIVAVGSFDDLAA